MTVNGVKRSHTEPAPSHYWLGIVSAFRKKIAGDSLYSALAIYPPGALRLDTELYRADTAESLSELIRGRV